MRDLDAKYTRVADDYSSRDYADAERYYARRAAVVVGIDPPLASGATLLDIACGDGGLGGPLLSRGIDYHGVDANERMVEVAKRTLGERIAQATFDHVPAEPVDATTIFRSLYLVPDRRAFFERVRTYTMLKLVFDFDPRAYDANAVIADLRAAGWRVAGLQPFLTPQRATLPRAVQRMLWGLEGLPGARTLTRIRFPLVVSASPV